MDYLWLYVRRVVFFPRESNASPNNNTGHLAKLEKQWNDFAKLNMRAQVADKKRFKFSKKITRGCHLFDPRYIGLF